MIVMTPLGTLSNSSHSGNWQERQKAGKKCSHQLECRQMSGKELTSVEYLEQIYFVNENSQGSHEFNSLHIYSFLRAKAI